MYEKIYKISTLLVSKIPVKEAPFTKLGVLHCVTQNLPGDTQNVHALLLVSLGVAIIMDA